MLPLLLLAACAKHPSDQDLAAVPRLPPPDAGTYDRIEATPTDPVVARVAAGVRWDASLSGAAAGLALDSLAETGGFAGWEVREAAWRAGWPYPVSQVRGWTTSEAAEPPAELLEWLAGIGADRVVGLVRARGTGVDLWVGLLSSPELDLGVVPRQIRSGEALTLRPVPDAELVVADPEGEVSRRPLDAGAEVTIGRTGEWMFEVRRGDRTLARFPLYAGITPPQIDLFTGDPLPDRPEERALALITRVREVYGAGALTREPTLDLTAAKALRGELEALDVALARLGYPPETTSRWTCTAPTVEACVDSVVWRPETRESFLRPATLLGLAVEKQAEQVKIQALIAE